MARKIIGALLALAVACLLAGCNYSHEINEMAYMVAVGLDKAEGGGLRVTFQFARPLAIAGGGEEGGGSGGGEEKTSIISVDSSDFYTALTTIGNILSKRISLSHTKLLLFSAEVAAEGIEEQVTMLMRDSRFSPNTYVALAFSGAEEYMKAVKPALEGNPARYYTLLFSRDNSDFIPSVTLRDLYFNLFEAGQSPVLPVANVSGESKTEELPEEKRDEAIEGNYVAGELGKESENKSEISGMAIISGGRLAGILPSGDVLLYNLLTGNFKETYYNLPSETEEGEAVILKLSQNRKPRQKVTLDGISPKIEIHVPVAAELVRSPSEEGEKELPAELSRRASKELSNEMAAFLNETAHGLGADVVGYGRHAKIHFEDFAQWDAYDWPSRLSDCEFSVHAAVAVTTEGLVHNE